MVLLALIGLLSFYQIFVGAVVQIGAIRSRRSLLRAAKDRTPELTLLVPARDEEKHLPALLASLEPQLDHFVGIVFVDDRSTDATGSLLDQFAARHEERVSVVHLTNTTPGPSPKLEAMKAGLPLVRGDVLLMTDADCVVPPHWAERMQRLFQDDTVGLVMAPVVAHRTGTLLSEYSLSEHIYRYMGAAGLSGMAIPAGGYGNNMAIRIDTLNEVGGFDAASVSVTEDAALVDLVSDHSTRTVRSLVGTDALVETAPVTSWKAMFQQLVRWQVGAVQSPDLFSRIGMSLLNLGYLAALICTVAAIWNPAFLIGPAGTVIGATIMYAGGGIHLRQPLRYWLLLPVNFLIMVCINAMTGIYAALNPRITWKGATIRNPRSSTAGR